MVFENFFTRKKVCTFLVNQEGTLSERHRHFQDFLQHNHEALNRIAELETIAYSGMAFGMGEVHRHCESLLASTRALVEALIGVGQGKYQELLTACERLQDEIAREIAPEPRPASDRLVIPFQELSAESMAYAGAKATNLAMAGNVLNLPVPEGFAITTHAFAAFLDGTGLTGPIASHLAAVTPEMTQEMEGRCAAVQELIRTASVPPDLAAAIFAAYDALAARHGSDVRIALRSSAVGEDTEASFAGQYLSRLQVTRDTLLDDYKEVLASKYTPRAIVYRLGYGLEDWETPMCVAGVVMVDAVASGVLYTRDPFAPEAETSRVSAVLGLGELLVAGEGGHDSFRVARQTNEIVERVMGDKTHRLDGRTQGGTVLHEVPEEERRRPAVSEETVRLLTRHGLALETHFGSPQDVEWAIDKTGSLFLLQSRPLMLVAAKADEPPPVVAAEHRVLLATGSTAARGAACGVVVLTVGRALQDLPPDAILVARTASPDYAALAGKIKGIITDAGSPASHLASVAREFGIPAIFGTENAASLLHDGQKITMLADSATVYEGMIPEFAALSRQARKPIFDSPSHRRLQKLLAIIAPLTLTDPAAPTFAPSGCATIHDIVRFAHETAMREMFRLTDGSRGGAVAAKLTCNIPLNLYCIDLGGGLRAGLTTCDTLTPDHFESLPMQAIWRGLAHPGITWSGTVQIGLGGLMGMMAASATAEAGGGTTLGGNSYAVLSRVYLNLSAKFGYHYANVDAYCSTDAGRNHILLQFAGGVGTYAGKSLRVHFLASVLGRLGYSITVTGDLLEASLKGADERQMAGILDQTGRLLAVSRLLDMAIANLEQAAEMTEAFFKGDYDFLGQGQNTQLPGFYTLVGQWMPDTSTAGAFCRQDGSKWGDSLSSGMAKVMGHMVGAKYQEFMDTIEAYYYFPIAIAKESAVPGDAVLRLPAMTEGGFIDQAAGLAFAIRNLGNYFVLRFNALEDNVMLFEFINNQRVTRVTTARKIEAKRWYELLVEVKGRTIIGYLDGDLVCEYHAERQLDGSVGLWTKADSVSSFGALIVASDGQTRCFGFQG